MKLRFYLRGLGIGIIVTALIMGMTTEAGQPLSDGEIRALAENLGMVDPGTLSLADVGTVGGNQQSAPPEEANQPKTSEKPVTGNGEDDSSSEEGNSTESPEPGEPIEPEESVVPSPTPDVAETPSPSPSPTPTEIPDKESVTIVIVRGDSSYTVSRRLVEAGLIEDARGFDSYLVDNGYSKTIRTGTYKIPLGATWEEIARIIA
ncbi:MAG: hypothetical protein J1E03_11510 [Acetatifactor sp.]|nr:hypothetical protein [Acetatifactor sp.]